MQPRRLTPRFLEKVWGATHLEPWFPDSAQKIGEVWLEGNPGLPLLIKFLFTTGKLPVQVHPGDDYAADMARIAADPKTQEWWTHTDPCQVRIVEERVPGALWQPIDEIWHLS